MKINKSLITITPHAVKLYKLYRTHFEWNNTSPTFPSTTVGTPTRYDAGATSSSGASPSYQIVGGSLPAGMTFNPATGIISGTPLVPGDCSVTIRITAPGAKPVDRTITFIVAEQDPVWNAPPQLGELTQGSTVDLSLVNGGSGGGWGGGAGGSGAYGGGGYGGGGSGGGGGGGGGSGGGGGGAGGGGGSGGGGGWGGWAGGGSGGSAAVSAGELPAGLILDDDGRLHGTIPPGATCGGCHVTIIITYPDGTTVDRDFTYVLVPDRITFNTPSNLGIIAGDQPCNILINVRDTGMGPTTYTVVGGSLPPGLTLNSDGSITGTPNNVNGSYSFTVQASRGSVIGTQTYYLGVGVSGATVSWGASSGMLGTFYGGETVSGQLAAVSGSGNVWYGVPDGQYLPYGMTLTPDGRLYGTVTYIPGNYCFNIRAYVSAYGYSDKLFCYTINADEVVWDTDAGSLGRATDDTEFSVKLLAHATSGRPVQFRVVYGSLANGLALDSDGTLHGTYVPSETDGASVTFTVRAYTAGDYEDREFTIDLETPLMWVTPEGTIGTFSLQENWRTTLVARSMYAPLSYAQSAGDPLPETVELNDDGVVQGYFTTISPDAPKWVTPRGSLATYNRFDTANLVVHADAADSRSIVNYSVVGDALLPAGLYLSALTGTITGRADLYIGDALEITTSKKPEPTWNTSAHLGDFTTSGPKSIVNLTLSADAHLGTAIASYALFVPNEVVPFGLHLDPQTGVLSGTISKSAATGEPSYTAAPTWTTPSSLGTFQTTGPNANVNLTLAATPLPNTTIASYTLSSTAEIIPFGLHLDPQSGALSGTLRPTAAGGDLVFTTKPTWSTAAGSLGSAQNGTAINVGLSASGATGFSVIRGAIPHGTRLTGDGSSTALTGTLAANIANTTATAALAQDTVVSFTVRAFDTWGAYADQEFTFQINAN